MDDQLLRPPALTSARSINSTSPTATEPGIARQQAISREEGIHWSRHWAAISRQKLFLLVFVAVGSLAGLVASRFVKPLYDAHATIWVNTPREGQSSSGPIRAGNLLQSTAWTELFRSYTIADSVSNTLRLYVAPENRADSAIFDGFRHAARFAIGNFVLKIDSAGERYEILDGAGARRASGLTSDSIGRSLGFLWAAPKSELRPDRRVRFRVVTPRDASIDLLGRLLTVFPEDGSFIRLQLSGTDPHLTAAALNTWSTQFVAEAAALKKRNLIEFEKILESQLVVAEREMRSSEIALESFRVNTITLPSEGGPVSAGVEMTRDPVMQSYFRQKTDYDDLRHDREALQQVLASASGEQLPDRLLSVAAAVGSSSALQSALQELNAKQAQLRAVRATLTDEHPTVKSLAAGVRVLQFETIPRLAQAILSQLLARERDLGARIDAASAELKRIPPRTIEEMRLRRQVAVSENLFNTLKSRYEEARLAEAGATPDVSVLDSATAPLRPSSNSAPRVLFLAIVVSLGLGLTTVILLDRLDARFRYPDQATNDLGLAILGAVPSLKVKRDGQVGFDLMTRAVEAFRTLRLSIRYALGHQSSIALTVTSPGAGDGKSVVCSNLALSFANAGCRTVIVDGDVRRGRLHDTFAVRRAPGLSDVLRGSAELEALLQPVPATPNLWMLARGSRLDHAPELLSSERTRQLVHTLRERFEVVVIDSPPLSAGVDAYALGVTTETVLIVLRAGTTNRKLTEAKLQVLDRLPVRLVGAVLNDIGETGEYRYYNYTYGDEKGKRDKNNRAALRIPTAVAVVGDK